MDELIEKLKDVGFNGYEAKVYIALLQYGNSTGYEVSKNSGVPQARAYDTLKALEAKKIIISTGEKPLTYMPVDPSEILSRYQEKQEKRSRQT
jgi:sugar-specific transcriptional regulator TrmB